MKQFVIVLFLVAATQADKPPVARPPAGQAKADLLRLEASLDAMGSVYSVVVYGEDKTRMEQAVEGAFEEVRRLDRMLSNYRAGSEWSQVNRQAAAGPVKISDELFELLATCLDYSRRSEGAFDISVGPLMKVWGFYKGTGRLPHRAEVRSALARVGYRKVLLDARERTVRFAQEGVELDPGGIGKGYAVDRMVGILKSSGIPTALISAGSSSIFAMGAPPGEPGWNVNIRHPKDERLTVANVVLKDESMSTSGNYEKFFFAGGRIYSHIMDPRTGYPAQGMLSVSVVAPTALATEAWTKPFFVNGRDWAAKNKPRDVRVFVCPDRGVRMEPTCAWLP